MRLEVLGQRLLREGGAAARDDDGVDEDGAAQRADEFGAILAAARRGRRRGAGGGGRRGPGGSSLSLPAVGRLDGGVGGGGQGVGVGRRVGEIGGHLVVEGVDGRLAPVGLTLRGRAGGGRCEAGVARRAGGKLAGRREQQGGGKGGRGVLAWSASPVCCGTRRTSTAVFCGISEPSAYTSCVWAFESSSSKKSRPLTMRWSATIRSRSSPAGMCGPSKWIACCSLDALNLNRTELIACRATSSHGLGDDEVLVLRGSFGWLSLRVSLPLSVFSRT